MANHKREKTRYTTDGTPGKKAREKTLEKLSTGGSITLGGKIFRSEGLDKIVNDDKWYIGRNPRDALTVEKARK